MASVSIATLVVGVVSGFGGLAALLRARAQNRRDVSTGDAQLRTTINAAVADLIESLERRLAAVELREAQCRKELEALKLQTLDVKHDLAYLHGAVDERRSTVMPSELVAITEVLNRYVEQLAKGTT